MSFEDRRERPRYSIEEAAEYLSIPATTLRAWAHGRRKKGSDEFYPSVLEFVDHESRMLSFYDLVEAHILRSTIELKIPLAHVKRGLKYLKEQYPKNPRPLLGFDFHTDGKHLLVDGMIGAKRKKEAIVDASIGGQLVMVPVIESFLRLVHRGQDRMPNTLFPKEGQQVVSITSGIVSGRPVIEGTRIPTSIIAQRFRAGEDPKRLAKDYRLPLRKIEAAIEYEEKSAA